MTTAIRAEDLSKIYRLGEVGTGTLHQDLTRLWCRLRGKEDPFLKIGQVNERSQRASDQVSGSDLVWALKDINFEVNEGEVLGIIGRNGAGKSTLLKLLARVTQPTTGQIKVRGRIASLLEVGTGFHPDLTGRENIFLNGAILGMRKQEIMRQFDDIVDFSGCERYIDTPVKRYSSGMYVRLAFAVAASLQTDILIVDEVLAVGDVEFQKKCLGKMSEVSALEGRTVLFVSHNMGSLSQLCQNGLLLENGRFVMRDRIDTVIESYLELGRDSHQAEFINTNPNRRGKGHISSMRMMDAAGRTLDSVTTNNRIKIEVKLEIHSFRNDLELSLSLQDKNGSRIFTIHEPINVPCPQDNMHVVAEIEIPDNLITPGKYSWIVAIHIPGVELTDAHFGVCHFLVVDGGTKFSRFENYGYMFVNNHSVRFFCNH